MSSQAELIYGFCKMVFVGPIGKYAMAPQLRELTNTVSDWMSAIPAGVTARQDHLAGLAAEWFEPENASSVGCILYLHGGGYTSGSIRTHRAMCGRLAITAGLPLVAIEYSLAPEHPYPQALDEAVAAYAALETANRGPIAISGDSAGGNLSLVLALALHDRGMTAPAALALLSPWTDLALTGETLRTKTDVDPYFRSPDSLSPLAEAYLAGVSPKEPLISPLYADLSVLPPTLIHVGDREVLLDDSRRLAEKAKQQRGPVEIEVWADMWHVWQLFHGRMPEADESLEKLGAFLGRHVSSRANA